MKFSKIMIVGLFLLAIMTLGAVSATDNLTVEETPDFMELGVDDADIISDDAGDENLGDGLIDPEMTVTNLSEKEVVFGDEAFIEVHLPENATGEVSFYVDGEKEESYELSGYDVGFCQYFDHFGTYDFMIDYSGDDVYMPANASFEYVLNDTQYYIGFDDPVEYGSELVCIYAPYAFNGELVVTVNGKRVNITEEYDDETDETIRYFDASLLNYGKNNLTISSEGDDTFGAYNKQETLYLKFKMDAPASFPFTSTDDAIGVELPEDANGTVTVISGHVEYDADENEQFVEDFIFDSQELKDGTATIPLSGLDVGIYVFKIVYEGNMGIMEDICYIDVYPLINITKVAQGNVTVTIESSPNRGGNLTVIEKIYDDLKGYTYSVLIASVELENDTACVILSDVDEDAIEVHYSAGNYTYSVYESIYMDDSDFEIEVEFHFANVIYHSEDENEIYWYLPEYATGEVIILLDGYVADEITLDGDEYYYYGLDTSELDYGNHTVEVNYVSEEYQNSSAMMEFEVVSADIFIPDEIVYGEWYESIEVWVNPDATGFITVLLDDEQYENITLEKGYIGYTFDIFNVPIRDYNVTVIYSGDDVYPGVTDSKIVHLTYNIEISHNFIEYSDEEEYYVNVIVPDDIGDGEFAVTVDGDSIEVEFDEYGLAEIPLQGLAFGSHVITVSYDGDEIYPALTVNDTIEVSSSISFPDSFTIGSVGNNISLALPEDANGTFTVYSGYLEGDVDEEFIIVDEICSAEVTDGNVSISLDDLEIGEYYLMAVYEGNYGPIQDYVSLSVNPKLVLPNFVLVGEKTSVKFEGSQDMEGTLTVYIEVWNDDWDEYELIEIGSADVVSGVGEAYISDLDVDEYSIYAEFVSDEFEYGEYGRLYVLENLDIDFEVEYDFTDVLIDSEDENSIYWYLPDYATGNVTIIVDGEVIDVVDVMEDSNYGLYTDYLDYGNHTLEVRFDSDDFSSDSSIKEFRVTSAVINIPEEIVYGEWDESIEIYVNPDATGTILILLDGEVYVNQTLEDGYYGYIYDIFDVPIKDYNVTVIYSGDETYPGVSASKIVNLSYMIYIYGDIQYGDEDDYYMVFFVPDDITDGEFNVTVDGMEYEATFEDGRFVILTPDLEYGEHEIIVRYAGDEIYPASEFSETVNVASTIHIPQYWQNGDDIHLILPGDAKGKLIVNIFSYSYDEDTDEEILTPYIYSQITLKNGKASYSLDNLEYGEYYIECSYEGNYEISDESNYFMMVPDIYWINETKYEDYYFFPYGMNSTLFIETPEWNGEYEISINLITAYGMFDVETEFISSEVITLIDGKAYYDLPILPLGDYIIAVEDIDSGESIFETTVYVTPYEINVPQIINLNEKNNITVVVPEDAIGNVSVEIYALAYDEYWDEYYWELHDEVNGSIENGVAVVEIPPLLDSYYAFVVYTITENYGEYYEAFEDIDADYFPIDPDLFVNVEDIEIGENATVKIEINKNITGTVTVDGDEINITDGQLDYVISNLAPGEHNITVVFNGDEMFNPSNYTASFKVSKLTPLINITSDEAIEGNDLVVTVEIAGATGNVTVNGENLTLTDGKVNLTITNLTAGNLTIEVNYPGDERYLNATNSTTITVSNKKDANVTVEVADIKIGENATVNIKINENATGKVLLNGEEIEIVNGTAAVVLSNLTVGQHDVEVIFEGDSRFNGENVTASFNVNKITPDVVISPGIAIEGEDLTILVSIAGATGNVVVSGEKYNLTDGKAVAVVKNLTAGDKIIRVSYSGDDKFAASNENIKVTVSPKKDSGLEVTVEDIEIGENATVNIKINRDVTGKLTVNGEEIALENGKATYVISDLPLGVYIVSVSFEGDKLFSACEKTATFNVSKVQLDPSVDPFSQSNDSAKPAYTISMPGDATGNLTVTVANETFTQELINGTATVNVEGIIPGNYEAVVSYSGDDKYAEITRTDNLTVKASAKIDASDLKMRFTAGNYFTITVYGEDGNVAPDTEVVFKVDGNVFETVKTDANGTASFKVTQLPGTYTVTAESLGVSSSNKLVVKHVLKLKKVKVKKSAKKLVLKATLKKVNGKYIKGKKVTFKFKGKKYKAKTNKKGVAKVTIKSNVLKKLKVGKKITYKAAYKGDKVKKSVKVKK